ncbi:MAG: hypothetical protein ACHQFZ_05295 [Acidimicrobiales bacterium]
MTDPLVDPDNQGVEDRRSFLNRPLSTWWCVLGWLGASAVFIGGTQLIGGVTSGDASDSINTTWAIAHGVPACAYAPGNQFGLPYSAPLYPSLSAALAALLRIGHGVSFPTMGQMGRHCSTAIAAMYRWSLRSHALRPTVELGYVGWLFLAAGSVSLLRTSGRGRNGWEPLTLLLIALVPSVSMCLHEYFHPQDLMAMGFVLGGLAAAGRGSWRWSGVLLGLAVATQQFAWLVLLPLAVVAPPRRVVRLAGAAFTTVAAVAAPLVVLSSSGALKAVLAGSGTTWTSNTLLDATRLPGPLLFFASRYLPIAAAMVLAWWAAHRLGEDVLAPVPLISLLATSLSLRLVFEVNLWGYYFMAVGVLLVLLDVIRGRVRWSLLGWLALVPVAFRPVLGTVSSLRTEATWWLPVWLWQVLLVTGAAALAISPLLSVVRSRGVAEVSATP